MAQPSHPTLINLPPPGSNPETPSEMPGTPTSTTTSLSALSTTAIKDGHRGHFPPGTLGRGHQHTPTPTTARPTPSPPTTTPWTRTSTPSPPAPSAATTTA
ncbi:hypothetical protein CDD83_2295 [Cordyceps sp. RAO-2017]|nr:hypothetical protein CDD83_2295 [Cordyceps sp. RAO-2017]